MFEALGPNKDLRREFVEFHRRQRADMTKLLRRGIEDGSIRSDTDAEDEATAVVTGLRGIAYQWMLDPDCFDPKRALAHLHASTEARIRARPAGGRRSGTSVRRLPVGSRASSA